MDKPMYSIQELKDQVEQLGSSLDLDSKKLEHQQLQQKTLASDFWGNENVARETMQQISYLETEINAVEGLLSKLNDLEDLENMLAAGNDPDLVREVEISLIQANKTFEKLRIKTYLSGEFDNSPAIISVFSGQGGTEAMDWASMLQRMYMRYFERMEFDYQITDISMGEEAGIKSVIFLVKGPLAYGYLKGETGTHRLVRLSPFNSDNLRQTSFAGVEVIPVISKAKTEIELKDEDLEWQFFRAGGAGGQNVNKVNTAVRVKHLPSGIIVSSQSERTQIRNREIALDILQSKLELQRRQEHQAKTDSIKGEHKIAGWGNQIRSYVLHPYQLVKDVRTQVETSNTTGVLDGDIQMFIEAEVEWLATN